jgi:DNA modification methylase
MSFTKSHVLKLTEEEYASFLKVANQQGFQDPVDYIKSLSDTNDVPVATNNQESYNQIPSIFHETQLGKMYHGDSRAYLFHAATPQSVDLIVTSPPFGLVRKKSYGNEDADAYCEWFRPFAEGFRRVLKDAGSLVIDIGGAWIPKRPTRSLYHFKLLLMLCEEYGFHLAQEHYWWNPSKLPTPAEWVNIRRVRVKDAVNTIWWLSPTPWPKASNRRVLAPYSDSMKNLLVNGYKPKLRPSGHDISHKFGQDNGGSVPPNLLAIANTESTGQYQTYCREHGIDIHPARFPSQLPEYFIRMLTNPGDLVVDPFGGSCLSGMVAENLGRKWVCVELNEHYLKGALGRFLPQLAALPKEKSQPYALYPPCCLPNEDALLAADGGASRPLLVPPPEVGG